MKNLFDAIMHEKKLNNIHKSTEDLKKYIILNYSTPTIDLINYVVDSGYCNKSVPSAKMLISDTLKNKGYYRESNRVYL